MLACREALRWYSAADSDGVRLGSSKQRLGFASALLLLASAYSLPVGCHFGCILGTVA